MQEAEKLLTTLNKTYARLYTRYENLFWKVYMGDQSLTDKKTKAQNERDAFCADSRHVEKVEHALCTAKGKVQKGLEAWRTFFTLYQTPAEVRGVREHIVALEGEIYKKQNSRTEGYTDPVTNKFVPASINTLSALIRTHANERVRKAAFVAKEALAQDCVADYVALVTLRNEYARGLGYEDFYAFKLDQEEGMTKESLFSLFDDVFDKTKHVFLELQEKEMEIPRLRKPWNFGYLMAGDFVAKEDPYFQFEHALALWGRSFTALGITYKGGTLTLDLLDRKRKHSNGFCHWPKPVTYENGVRQPGSAGFTCNVVPGVCGQGVQGMYTLFHEGGHAAHLLNSVQTQVCLNTEYPPASTAWAETQSMFLEGMFSSVEWKTRYAHNSEGVAYPFSLYQERVEKMQSTAPLGMMSIMMMAEFEKKVYECKNLTPEKVKQFAKQMHKKYTDQSAPSLWILNVIHLYRWDAACSYHAYGLAQMAVSQWREYFYKKYGHIVDNPQVGKEMAKVWALGASQKFPALVQLATGKKLSASAFVAQSTASVPTVLAKAKKRIMALENVKRYSRTVKLDATIKMVHGPKTIATNKKSFEDMAEKYAKWLEKQG